MQKLRLEVELAERGPTVDSEARQRYQELLLKTSQEAERYSADKREIEAEARKFEHERDL